METPITPDHRPNTPLGQLEAELAPIVKRAKRGRFSAIKYATILVIAGFSLAIQACAVGMAASGHKNMDTSIAFPGSNRAVVLSKLGPPDNSRSLDNGYREDTYIIKEGNEASAGRAWAHAGMDLMSFFIWELVASPYELVQMEKAYKLMVIYDSKGTVTDILKKGVERDVFSTDPLPWAK